MSSNDSNARTLSEMLNVNLEMAKKILSKCNNNIDTSINEYFANPEKFTGN